MVTVVLLSSRQLGFLNIPPEIRQTVDFVAIMSKAEAEALPPSTRAWMSRVEHVPIASNDGVLWRYDEMEALALIRALPRKPTAIVTFDEGATLLAANLRAQLDVPGARPDEILRYRDKLLMKRHVRAAGLKTPEADRLPQPGNWPSYTALAARFGPRMVIKPVDSAGTNAVHIVADEDAFTHAVKRSQQLSLDYEIETFAEGKLYHCDTIWSGDELLFTACTEYVAPTIDFQNGFPLGGRAMNPHSTLAARLIDFAVGAVRALGVASVAQHTELMVGPDGAITFIESGARPPGMLVAQMYERAFGLNILTLALAANVGEALASVIMPPAVARPPLLQDAFYLVYPRGHGWVTGVRSPPDDLVGRLDMRSHTIEGDWHEGSRSNLDFTTTVLCGGDRDFVDHAYAAMTIFTPVEYAN
jgi:biotin carboxylase